VEQTRALADSFPPLDSELGFISVSQPDLPGCNVRLMQWKTHYSKLQAADPTCYFEATATHVGTVLRNCYAEATHPARQIFPVLREPTW
jgi:hypothetical protein